MKRTVAFLDVLGFRKMVEMESADSLGAIYDRVNHRLEAFNKPFGELHKTKPSFFSEFLPDQKYCIKHIFSDSIILVSNDETEKQCLALLIYALRSMQHMLAHDMSVRGGIVHGEIFLDSDNKLFVGKALTHAYDLELKQNWIGAAIDNSVIETFPNLFNGKGPFPEILDCLFPLYEVPMKSGPIKKLHTLNWRWNLSVESGTRSLFKETDDWSAHVKIEAALKYAKYIRDSKKAYPVNRESTPVEVRSIFIGADSYGEGNVPHGDEL